MISRDDFNGEICFVIRDLEKFWILTEFYRSTFFQKFGFPGVLQFFIGLGLSCVDIQDRKTGIIILVNTNYYTSLTVKALN